MGSQSGQQLGRSLLADPAEDLLWGHVSDPTVNSLMFGFDSRPVPVPSYIRARPKATVSRLEDGLRKHAHAIAAIDFCCARTRIDRMIKCDGAVYSEAGSLGPGGR